MAGDDATAAQYTDPGSARTLGFAADVLRSFGSAFGNAHLAIVGGAIPGLLVPRPTGGMDAHVGTSDLDLHVSLYLMDGETEPYEGSIVDGLESLGLQPAQEDGRTVRWRWVGQQEGIGVRVEFLCPRRTGSGLPEQPAPETPAERNIGPVGRISALSMGYGHLVFDDTERVVRRVVTIDGEVDYPFPVAGLASWLALKADAITLRRKWKDGYDVVWLIQALGPVPAADAIMGSRLLARPANRRDTVHQVELLLSGHFRNTRSIGPRYYGRFFGRPDDPTLRRDAVGVMQSLRDELDGRGFFR